ncbi:MAG TPA: hypothetical protein VJT32_02610 [bacterium]|nr:hypothetical protein [bacterium]
MDSRWVTLAIILVVLVAIPASAVDQHPGSCIAIYNQTKSTIRVRVVKPEGYSDVVWTVTPRNPATSLGVTLKTLGGPIVSPNGDWDISTDPPSKEGWQYVPTKADSCIGTWYVSVGVSAR